MQQKNSPGRRRVPEGAQGPGLLLVVGLLLSVCSPVLGQYSAAQVSNTYLRLTAGISGDVEDAGPSRDATVEVAGRFGIGTGDAAIVAGAPDPWGGYIIIKVDELESVIYGDADGGIWLSGPAGDETTDTITDSYQLDEFPIVITRTMRILRDVVRFEFQVSNQDVDAHSIGIGVFVDAEYGLDPQSLPITGGPFYSPLSGTISEETELSGNDVPDVLYGFDNLPAYATVTQTLLSGGEITTPDRVVAAQADTAWGDFWGYTPVTSRSILADSALLLFWEQRQVLAGRERDPVIFYFGRGDATEDFNPPAVLALEGPFTLSYERAEDETVGSFVPDPFTVRGLVYNLSPQVPLRDVQVQLTLGFGLAFEEGEIATKTIGDVAPGAEQPVTWEVYADGTEFGPLSYTISVVGFPLGAKSVTRTVNVPATEARFFFGGDWEMVSIPFVGENTEPAAFFGLSQAVFDAVRYDPRLARYVDVTSINPGEGFWLRTLVDVDIVLQDAEPLGGSFSDVQLLNLAQGWNQIGNPYLYGLAWGRFQFLRDPSQGSISLSEAIERRWIRGTVYWYDPLTGDYEFSSSPSTVIEPWMGYWIKVLQPVTLVIPPIDQIGGGVTVSTPVAGLSNDPVAETTMSSFYGLTRRTAQARFSDWSVQLSATGKDAWDRNNFFGQSADARDDYDSKDVDEAPPADSVSLSFLNSAWGEDSGRYARDIRGQGSRKSWLCEVRSSAKDQTVRLTWSGLESVPRGTTLSLYDKTARRWVRLRPGGSYSVKVEAGEPRLFDIVAQTRRTGRSR